MRIPYDAFNKQYLVYFIGFLKICMIMKGKQVQK